MSYTGTVEHGMVKLPPEAVWADGTKVRVEPVELEAVRRRFASEDLIGSVDGDGIPATNERVRKVMGCGRQPTPACLKRFWIAMTLIIRGPWMFSHSTRRG